MHAPSPQAQLQLLQGQETWPEKHGPSAASMFHTLATPLSFCHSLFFAN